MRLLAATRNWARTPTRQAETESGYTSELVGSACRLLRSTRLTGSLAATIGCAMSAFHPNLPDHFRQVAAPWNYQLARQFAYSRALVEWTFYGPAKEGGVGFSRAHRVGRDR